MANKQRTSVGTDSRDHPTFEARQLKSVRGWYVRVSWQYGQMEHVGGFASEQDADSWIKEKAQEWLRNRTAALRGI
jgi:hypothetical protein